MIGSYRGSCFKNESFLRRDVDDDPFRSCWFLFWFIAFNMLDDNASDSNSDNSFSFGDFDFGDSDL